MTEQAPEQAPIGDNTPPAPVKGSGQFAVYDHDLNQYVSGVSDKATADKARKALESHNGTVTEGHKLETREV